MKNHNDMTLDECRDELAVHAGWDYLPPPDLDNIKPGQVLTFGAPWSKAMPGGIITMGDIPMGDDLDAIAGAMPDGWWLTLCHEPRTNRSRVWIASGSDTHEDGGVGFRGVESRADTEILARARLAVACWRAQKGANP